MPRIARVCAVGYSHHITQRGNDKGTVDMVAPRISESVYNQMAVMSVALGNILGQPVKVGSKVRVNGLAMA